MLRFPIQRTYDLPPQPTFALGDGGWQIQDGDASPHHHPASLNTSDCIFHSSNGQVSIRSMSALDCSALRYVLHVNGFSVQRPIEDHVHSPQLNQAEESLIPLCFFELEIRIDGELLTVKEEGTWKRLLDLREGVSTVAAVIRSKDFSKAALVEVDRLASLVDGAPSSWFLQLRATPVHLVQNPPEKTTDNASTGSNILFVPSEEKHQIRLKYTTFVDGGYFSTESGRCTVFAPSTSSCFKDTTTFSVEQSIGRPQHEFGMKVLSDYHLCAYLSPVLENAVPLKVEPIPLRCASPARPTPFAKGSSHNKGDATSMFPKREKIASSDSESGPGSSATGPFFDQSGDDGVGMEFFQQDESPMRMITANVVTAATSPAQRTFCLTLSGEHQLKLKSSSSAVFSQEPSGDAMSEKATDLSTSLLRRFEETKKKQKEVLLDFWSRCQVGVEIQDEIYPNRLTQALRFSAYEVFCNTRWCGQGVAGIPKAGLSSSTSEDDGQFCLQHCLFYGWFLLFTSPPEAVKFLALLHSMLGQARALARRLSLPRGALFPLRTIFQPECGAYFLDTTARAHVNADIAYLISLYFDTLAETPTIAPAAKTSSSGEKVAEGQTATSSGGESTSPKLSSSESSELPVFHLQLVELLLETARIWLLLGNWNDARSGFQIDGVTGPDEYNVFVENDFYTNVMAKRHLLYASDLLHKFQAKSPKSTLKLLKQLNLSSEELMEMQAAGKAIIIPRDNRLQVSFSHAHFDSLPEWDVLNKPLRYPLPQFYHPIVIYKHKLCQVPSVLLAMLLDGQRFEQTEIRMNLKYYEPFCTHDVPESLAILAAFQFRSYGDFGKGTDAIQALAALDLDNILHEDKLHLSTMAATWFVLVLGIGGLRMIKGTVHLSPSLPVGWSTVQFTLTFQGATVRCTITPEEIEYALLKGTSVRFIHFDTTRVHLYSSIVRGSGTIHSSSSRVKEDENEHRIIHIPRSVRDQVTAHFDGIILSFDSIVSNYTQINFTAWYRVLERHFDRVRHQEKREIASLTLEEYANNFVRQEDVTIQYGGLAKVLKDRQIDLPLGAATDAEIVDTRFGLANAKLSELNEMLTEERLAITFVPGVTDLLWDLRRLGLRVGVVSYSRSMLDLLTRIDILPTLFTTYIDGVEAREKKFRGRPYLDLYERAAKKMHLPPSRCVVFGSWLEMYGCSEEEKQQNFRAFFKVVDEEVRAVLHDSPSKQQQAGVPQAESSFLHQENFPNSVSRVEDLVLRLQH